MWQLRRSGETGAEAWFDTPTRVAKPGAEPAPPSVSERVLSLKVEIHRQLLDRINLSALDKMPRQQIALEVADIIGELLESHGEVLNRSERAALSNEVLDELLGLGPLEPLLKD